MCKRERASQLAIYAVKLICIAAHRRLLTILAEEGSVIAFVVWTHIINGLKASATLANREGLNTVKHTAGSPRLAK